MTGRKHASEICRERLFRTVLTEEKGSILLWIVLAFSFVGILAGWGLSLYKAPTENRARMETLEHLETVKQAFYGYAKTYKLLPRPAEWDGSFEETGSAVGPITSYGGTVPWTDLGLKPMDAWGRRPADLTGAAGGKLRYQVHYGQMCNNPQTACNALSKYKQNLPAVSGDPRQSFIDLYENGQLRYVPALIISAGPSDANKDGRYFDIAGSGNNNPPNPFTPFVRSLPTSTFDDILVYLDPFVLYDVMDCHCRNGVLDEDETGVDCGGSDCLPCPPP